MKKTIVAFMVVALFGWGLSAVSPAEAVNSSAAITVTVTVQHLSMTVTDGLVEFGAVEIDTNTINTADAQNVTNSGNITETFSLQLTTTDVYLVGTTEAAAAENTFVLEALFLADGATAPNNAAFGVDSGTGDDVVLTTIKAASATDFGLSTDTSNGLSVLAAGERDLYFNYGSPTTVTTGVEENLEVTLSVTAG